MKVFTLICALLVIGSGAAEFYGWGGEGDGPRTLISAIPAVFGAVMLLGTLLAIFFRRIGLQIAFLSALAGGFAGLGRLAPPYLKETLDWNSYSNRLIAGMSVICLVYVLVASFCYLFVRRKPVKAGVIGDGVLVREESGEKEEDQGVDRDENEDRDQDKDKDKDKEKGSDVEGDGSLEPEESEEEKESEASILPLS